VAGAAVQFLRDNLNFFENAKETEEIALSVPDNNGVVFVTALTGLGAPYWNPNARGAIMGLSRGTTNAHITRATLEAQAFQTRDLMEAMMADSQTEIQSIRVDGGLVANGFVCQELANQTGVNIDRPINQEATVWGAAAMAFYQAGVFESFDDIAHLYELEKQFTPDGDDKKNNHLYAMWQKAIECIQGY
jgi:glycerol kinase